jgi:hypothetical protein
LFWYYNNKKTKNKKQKTKNKKQKTKNKKQKKQKIILKKIAIPGGFR